MKKSLILLMFLFPIVIYGQNSSGQWLQFGLNGGLAFPQDEFAENYPRPRFNGQIDILFGIPKINSLVGLQVGRVFMGNSSKTINDTIQFIDGTTALGVEGVAETQMNNVNLSLRFVPWKESLISPYFDVFGGLQLIKFTTTTFALFKNGNEIIYDEEDTRYGLSYGGAFGLLYRYNEYLQFDAKVQYNKTTITAYPVMDDLSFDRYGKPIIDIEESKTDILRFNLGAVFYMFKP
ncbi:MAG: hypothetical protein R6T91_00470 [Bacteroidales bacterium]